MVNVHISLHQFIKTSDKPVLDDKKRWYYAYECTVCGLKGVMLGDSQFIEVDDNKLCAKPKIGKRKIIVNPCPGIAQFGFKAGDELEVVDCPIEWAHVHKNAVWVYSSLRKEPVRLLINEYTEVKGGFIHA